ncbi:MAG: DegV family protein [Bacillota bacterium]
MKMEYLDGIRFLKAFKNGAELVSARKHHLNDINLFPIPDSDTGNNMSFTLKTTALKVNPDTSIYNTLKSIADNAIESARGNSGLILAQFFSGLFEKVKKKNQINTEDFAEAVRDTVPYLYNNIDNPQEGTMLTVIRDWSEKMHEYGKDVDDFILLFNKSMETALKSLENTKNQLEILRENNTVDAGAQGFIYFLEGMLDYWTNPDHTKFDLEKIAEEDLIEEEEITVSPEKLKYRYCTEVFMVTEKSADKIRKILHDKGDSLIVVSSSKRMRIHIHTDKPDSIVSILGDKGEIIDQKVDDMQRQSEIVYNKKSEIALVTDSIADLPQNILDKYQIHVIPLNLVIDGVNFLDKLTITSDYFYNYVEEAENFPSSSQPTVDYIYKNLKELAEHYKSILIISVSEALSGTAKSFKEAIKKLNNELKNNNDISFINSRLNSGAQGLLVQKAAELIAEGYSLTEVTSKIKNYRENSSILVNVNTIDYMIQGGRVSPMKGFFARLFNLKPIISLDENGDGIIWDKAFSRKSVNKKILNQIKEVKNSGNLEKYNVVHADAEEMAKELAAKIEKIVGYGPEYIMNISSITALNSGKDAIAVSYLAE